jgi:hypothetical protein
MHEAPWGGHRERNAEWRRVNDELIAGGLALDALEGRNVEAFHAAWDQMLRSRGE